MNYFHRYVIIRIQLSQELEHQSQEKRRLHAQYAREIEAAHSKLTEKETSLEENYLRSIQQLREQHQQGCI